MQKYTLKIMVLFYQNAIGILESKPQVSYADMVGHPPQGRPSTGQGNNKCVF